jgi:hypothetical protein
LAAARTTHGLSVKAMDILDDPNRIFASSIYVKLEVLPKAIYHKQSDESDFYNEFFKSVKHWAAHEKLPDKALKEAAVSGLNGIDALHVVAAHSVKADEFITVERPTSPLFRTKLVKVVSLL